MSIETLAAWTVVCLFGIASGLVAGWLMLPGLALAWSYFSELIDGMRYRRWLKKNGLRDTLRARTNWRWAQKVSAKHG